MTPARNWGHTRRFGMLSLSSWCRDWKTETTVPCSPESIEGSQGCRQRYRRGIVQRGDDMAKDTYINLAEYFVGPLGGRLERGQGLD